jgi:hypothetical protein
MRRINFTIDVASHPRHVFSTQGNKRNIFWHITSDMPNYSVLDLIYWRRMPFMNKCSPEYALSNEKYVNPFPLKKRIEITGN